MTPDQSTTSRSLRSLEFTTHLGAAAFLRRLSDLVEKDKPLNDCFIPDTGVHFYRVWGMALHGQISFSHADFGSMLGTRVNIRYRKGDEPLVEHLIKKMGAALKPLTLSLSGQKPSRRPDRTVGHFLQKHQRAFAKFGLVITESAIESGLDWLFDDEAEMRKQLALVASLQSDRKLPLEWELQSIERVGQLRQTYTNTQTCYFEGRRVLLNRQCHIPDETGESVLRYYFGEDKKTGRVVVGWVDEYPMTP